MIDTFVVILIFEAGAFLVVFACRAGYRRGHVAGRLHEFHWMIENVTCEDADE